METRLGVGAFANTLDTRAPVPTAPAHPGLEAGLRLQQYELIRELGRGGMGVVWIARDVKLGRRVAIKFLLDARRDVAERFLVEARATAKCSHDNIVIIHEVDEHDDMPYMVLELLDGEPLRALMGDAEAGRSQRLPPSRVVELCLPIARALERAHSHGIVHRDLKPENVILTRDGHVKVLDFGIARALDEQNKDEAISGTLPYLAPEQLGGHADKRTDLWALGVMMFEMLAGVHPVSPFTTEALFENLVDESPMRPIRQAATDVPEKLAALVNACLQKKPDLRVASAEEVVARLEQLVPRRRTRKLGEEASPFPGLTAFHEDDADRFFGRTRDIAHATARIRELPLVVIAGPSGVGKTSFLRAGVGPALQRSDESWRIVSLRPGRAPIAALAGVLERLCGSVPVARIRSEPGCVGALLRERARADGTRMLIVVDQLEELYTLARDGDERLAFTTALSAMADDPTAPLRVVVSMRSDFLDRVVEDRRFADDVARGLVLLAPPDREGLREAIEQPVEAAGYRFDPEVVADMLDSLGRGAGALPLLQFAAAKLWEDRDRTQRVITFDSYRAIGGVSGALAAHADKIVGGLAPDTQRLVQKLFRALITPERTRAIVELAELRAQVAETDRLVDLLVASRLLIVQARNDGSSVEIVHESLIDRWPTLRRWLDEGHEDAVFRTQLAAAAKQWDQKRRPAGLLWRGEAMEEARRWFTSEPRALPERDEAYIRAVLALARRQKRRNRVLLIVAFALLGAIAAGATIMMFRIDAANQSLAAERDRAEAARDEAEQREKARLFAEQERKRAELEKTAAQREMTAAQVAAADAERAAAEAEERKLAAERDKATAEGKVQLSREELVKKNDALERAITEARAARDRADTARRDAEAARAELQKKLAAEEAKVRDLEKEKARLTTKLRD